MEVILHQGGVESKLALLRVHFMYRIDSRNFMMSSVLVNVKTYLPDNINNIQIINVIVDKNDIRTKLVCLKGILRTIEHTLSLSTLSPFSP